MQTSIVLTISEPHLLFAPQEEGEMADFEKLS